MGGAVIHHDGHFLCNIYTCSSMVCHTYIHHIWYGIVTWLQVWCLLDWLLCTVPVWLDIRRCCSTAGTTGSSDIPGVHNDVDMCSWSYMFRPYFLFYPEGSNYLAVCNQVTWWRYGHCLLACFNSAGTATTLRWPPTTASTLTRSHMKWSKSMTFVITAVVERGEHSPLALPY